MIVLCELIALKAARTIQSASIRARALTALAPYVPEVVPEALDAVRTIQDVSDRATALTDLAP